LKDFTLVAGGTIILISKNSDLTFPINIQKEIDKIWYRLKVKNNTLFDAQSPIVLDIKKMQQQTLIKVSFVNYRAILADRENPKLGIAVHQIGVSGITILNDDKVVFAQRNHSTTEYPGMIELIPSGNIDKTDIKKDGHVDYISKLKKEFEEETGIPKSTILDTEPLCLVKDNKNQIYDVCCKIRLDKNEDEFIDLFSNRSEYKKPFLVRLDELGSFQKNKNKRIIPTSKAIITFLTNSFG